MPAALWVVGLGHEFFQKPLFFVFSTPPPRAGLACGLRPPAAFRCSLLQPGIPTPRDWTPFLCDEQRALLPEGLGPRRPQNVVLWSAGMPCPGARKVYGRTGILGPWPGESRSRGTTKLCFVLLLAGRGACSEPGWAAPPNLFWSRPFPSGFRVFVWSELSPAQGPFPPVRGRPHWEGQPWSLPRFVWGRPGLHPWPHGTRVDDRSDRRL